MLNALFKRKLPRRSVESTASFVAASGATYVGVSKNISLESLLLVADSQCHVNHDEHGEIVVKHKAQTYVLPCNVVRSGKYCLDKYYIALKFDSQEARDLFSAMIVHGKQCHSCGTAENLERCPKCNGINTICRVCLMQNAMCEDCRADELLYESKQKSQSVGPDVNDRLFM